MLYRDRRMCTDSGCVEIRRQFSLVDSNRGALRLLAQPMLVNRIKKTTKKSRTRCKTASERWGTTPTANTTVLLSQDRGNSLVYAKTRGTNHVMRNVE